MLINGPDYNSEIDIITQLGMIEPIVNSASLIPGVFNDAIEIIGSFTRKNYSDENKPCIDLLFPVNSKETAKKVTKNFSTIPGPSKNKGYMLEIGIGWGWIGIIPAIRTNVKNYYYFVDYERDCFFLTNPIIHTNYILNCGRKQLINLIKKDFASVNIEINSFALELLVINALEGFTENSDAVFYKKVLEYMVQNYPYEDLLDPSNNDNIISKGIKNDVKEQIKIFAENKLENLE
jgi:hypothetical protein